jgi:hypothetical protein
MVAKLEQNYHQDALRLQAIKKWSMRFRAGRETVGDDEKAERLLRNDMGSGLLRFLDI